MFKSKKLIYYNKNITHFFFNSAGGVSTGKYKSLNCGLGSNDKPVRIKKNLNLVRRKIKCKKNNLILLNQIHSNKTFKVLKTPTAKMTGDGLVTKKKGIALGILTADCAPILFYDPKKKIIGAAHAGWRGALINITKNVLYDMKSLGSHIEDIITVIGPCIGYRNYEVKADFKKKFLNKYNCKECFVQKRGLIFFNLSKFIKLQLMKNGVKHIDIIKKDTFERNNKFFSSRYSSKNNYDDYGRNISVIMIK